jgi:NADH-quinone oxidoreductase subunit F
MSLDFAQIRATVEKEAGCLTDKSCSRIPIGTSPDNSSGDLPFNLQNRIVLRNCGRIDPGNIDHYILAANGFAGLSRALLKSRRESMHAAASSTFSGYIHSGSSSPDRWNECLESESPDKCLICVAVAAGPGEQGTQFLLENDPHSILEGMLIGAYVVGASRCILYIRSGGRAASNLQAALNRMQYYGLVGSGILNSSFNASFEIREVPATFRMGQELESLRCIGRDRTLPHILPTFPAIEELTTNPFIIVNPESMAYMPAVFLTDEELQTGFGADKNIATGIVTLSGCIVNAVTAEVPCGVSIRSVIEEIGGGVAGGKAFKALQAGVPSGILLGPGDLDDCMHCRTSGESGTGSTLIDVMESGADIVEIAGTRMAAVNEQSCGKCLFCFEGSRQMHHVLAKIVAGRGKPKDLDLLKELGDEMKNGCLCAFGRTAPDLVLSSMELFRKEYEERIDASPA